MKILKLFICILSMTISIADAQVAERFDIVITEILADPTPSAGLPNAEFIEIRNRSSSSFSLAGWRIGDAGTTVKIASSYTLGPDSIVILCSNSQVNNFSPFGKTIGVPGFPSLDNDGDVISLYSPEGKLIHAVAYSSEWYPNSLQKEGGWSLEMIDPGVPCSGAKNWTASTHSNGGTPGKKNSVDGITIDHDPPQLIRTYNKDSLTVIAVFNEPLDSASASGISNYSIDNNISIMNVQPLSPLFNQVALSLLGPFQKEKIYQLTVKQVTDCMNNAIGAYHHSKAGWPQEPLQKDIVINEILFNPKPNAFDFVELYNCSDKVLDASRIFIANRTATGDIGSAKKISESIFNIYPGEHFVITEDASSLELNYFVKQTGFILPVSSMPSYPDDEGTVIITNSQGMLLDEVHYIDEWHFALITNPEGVSLERLDPAGNSSDNNNWHSASHTSGFATPTAINSQLRQVLNSDASLTIHPKVFSPDNDGYDDIAMIQYQIGEPGYVANVTIFDALGRPVRSLVKNGLTGLKGAWTWDGLNDKMETLPMGPYIIFTELFNLQGKKKYFKNSIMLARMLR